MKTKKINLIEIETEIIAQLSQEQSDDIQGGKYNICTCRDNTCNTGSCTTKSE
jgi:hypothetical protein